tara:strand:- start:312 stop:1106 length:795 start_codon:yes stop_codon:yes gene_type:complete
MSKYFNVDVIPDCIAGDVSDNNGGDVDAGDIVFDWTAVDVPKGSCLLRSVGAYVNGEDGVGQGGSVTDYELIFAKSVDGVAPPTIGVINNAQTGCGALRSHFVGGIRLEGDVAKGTLSKTTFGSIFNSGPAGGADTNVGVGFVIDLEPSSGANVGYDTLYVAGFQSAARNYGTGVLLDQAGDADYDASADLQTSYIVDGVDATKIFSVGDQVYVADLDTPIPGTLTKVEPLLLTFSEVNSTVDISNNDELLNANPIRIRLGFER